MKSKEACTTKQKNWQNKKGACAPQNEKGACAPQNEKGACAPQNEKGACAPQNKKGACAPQNEKGACAPQNEKGACAPQNEKLKELAPHKIKKELAPHKIKKELAPHKMKKLTSCLQGLVGLKPTGKMTLDLSLLSLQHLQLFLTPFHLYPPSCFLHITLVSSFESSLEQEVQWVLDDGFKPFLCHFYCKVFGYAPDLENSTTFYLFFVGW